MAAARVPFTEEAVKAHLDGCIRFWRERIDRDAADEDVLRRTLAQSLAQAYLDAFQSVRTSLFGETLP